MTVSEWFAGRKVYGGDAAWEGDGLD
jgi:hypothetical protein